MGVEQGQLMGAGSKERAAEGDGRCGGGGWRLAWMERRGSQRADGLVTSPVWFPNQLKKHENLTTVAY